jgi:hypothetical protein
MCPAHKPACQPINTIYSELIVDKIYTHPKADCQFLSDCLINKNNKSTRPTIPVDLNYPVFQAIMSQILVGILYTSGPNLPARIGKSHK